MNASDIISLCAQLANDRTTLDSHLQEVADLTLPRKGQITAYRTPGGKRQVDVFDSTAILDLEMLSAGMHSFLCPTDQQWFRIATKSKSKNDRIGRYFSEVTEIIADEIAHSNFNLQVHESFLDLGWAGTSCLFLEESESKQSCLTFKNLHYTTFLIRESNSGEVDTLIRRFEMTARQALQEFKDATPQNIKEAAGELVNQDKKFQFIHFVGKRQLRDKKKKDKLNLPWESVYVDVQGKKIISEGGYNEQPFMTPRFAKDSGEQYGRSPAMNVLPNIKMLNQMMRTIIIAAQKVVDPPWLVPDNNSVHRLSTTPGSIIYYNNSNPNNKPEPISTRADIGLGMDMVGVERETIHRAFMTDLFAMLQQQSQQMTATEVLARLEEKISVFAPTLGRLQVELFDILLQRAYGICERAGKLPQPPQELLEGDGEYNVVYTSRAALMAQSVKMKSTYQFMEFVSPLAQIDPSVLDNIDLDKTVRHGISTFAVPVEITRSEDDVKKLREQRAMQQQATQEQAMLGSFVGKADPLKQPQSGSVLDRIAKRVGM